MTISRGTKYVPLELLDVLKVFLKNNTLKFGAAFEVGSRNYNLHVQSAFSIRYPKSAESQRELTKHIKALLPDNGKGYRIQCEPVLDRLGRRCWVTSLRTRAAPLTK